jgi:hypothetical protein
MFSSRGIVNGFSPFAGFGAFGEDQALRGAVVDVVVDVGDAGRVFFYDSRLAQSLRDRLNASGFKVLALDASNLGSLGGGGTLRARVQILSDGYASAQDAASVVAGAASYLGYNATGSQGVLVSSGSGQVAGTQSGGAQTGQTYENPGQSGAPNPVTTLFDSLTQSPISLAVVVGGAALLLILATKK